MVIYAVLGILLVAVIFLFSSPALSPIPYFPSNNKDMKLITKSLGLKNNQTVVDLGAGDGVVVFEAAKEALKKGLDTKFVAVEINPILIAILYLRRLFHPNGRNIAVQMGDIFTMDFENLIKADSSPLFYIYISPWHIDKTMGNIKRQTKKFKIVSYMYPVKSMRARERMVKGLNSIFIYG